MDRGIFNYKLGQCQPLKNVGKTCAKTIELYYLEDTLFIYVRLINIALEKYLYGDLFFEHCWWSITDGISFRYADERMLMANSER